MWPFRRRPAVSEKEAALVEAHKAIARLRREKAKVERYRAGKQSDPATRTTSNQWLGGDGT